MEGEGSLWFMTGDRVRALTDSLIEEREEVMSTLVTEIVVEEEEEEGEEEDWNSKPAMCGERDDFFFRTVRRWQISSMNAGEIRMM